MQPILHMLFHRKCVRKATWDQGVLRCPCGQLVALRYQVGSRTATFVLPRFSRMREEIIKTGMLSDSSGVIGAISFDDFDDAVRFFPPLRVGRDLEEADDREEENDQTGEEDT